MQQKYYDESFKHSHRVLLVSHSQGNMFANRIYDTINPTGYKSYFANMQVASPASSIHSPKGEYVTGLIDPAINLIPGSMEYNAILTPSGHAFVSTYLDTLDSRTKIVKGIKKLLLELDNTEKTPSQWKTKSEIEKGTKEYRITVNHSFDDGVLDIDDEVYPFNIKDGRVYQVKDTAGTPHYVKASFGGERILDGELDNDLWEAEDNQFYKLEGTDPVEYIQGVQGRFIRNSDTEIVTDTETGRMWQDDSEARTTFLNWNQAIIHCSNLILAGYSDWQLPNLEVLDSIVDQRSIPKLYNEFVNVSSTEFKYYWSSTEVDQNYAWDIRFQEGYGYSTPWGLKKHDTSICVRCVRF